MDKMNKFIAINLILFVLIVSNVCSQNISHLPKQRVRCYTDESYKDLKAKNPTIMSTQDFEAWLQPLIYQHVKNRIAGNQNGTLNFYKVALVFHIINHDEPVGIRSNISQTLVQQEVLQLNKDYANLSNSPYAVAANTGIQFGLAAVDPKGNTLAEPGIDRESITANGWTDSSTFDCGNQSGYFWTTIKPATIWDPTKYVNVWVCDMSYASLLGIATLPTASTLAGLTPVTETSTNAGIIVDFTSVGSVNVTNPNNLNSKNQCGSNSYAMGKSATHELGHYFGLRHIWGDGTSTTTCATDYVADTPPALTANYGTPTHPKPNICGTADEMFENYMDYSDDHLLNTFTQNQVDRMQTVLLNSPNRKTLNNAVAMVDVIGSNKIRFVECSGSINVIETGTTGTYPRYHDVNIVLNIENVATDSSSVLSVNATGSAITGVDYQIMNPSISIAKGDNSKVIQLRIFDNEIVDGDRYVDLSYTISGTGVSPDNVAQNLRVYITDDDDIKIGQNRTSLINQNFGTTGGSIPTGWYNNSSTTNNFVVGSVVSAGMNNQYVYITNNTTTKPLTYDKGTPGYTALQFAVNGLSLQKLDTFAFTYKIGGVADNAATGAAGDQTYSLYYDIRDTLLNMNYYGSTGGTANTGYGPYVSQTTAKRISLIPTYDMVRRKMIQMFYFQTGTQTTGKNPGFEVDSVVIRGMPYKVETAICTGYGFDVPSLSYNVFRSPNNKAMFIFKNGATKISNLSGSIVDAGSTQATFITTSGTYNRAKKVYKLASSVVNTTSMDSIIFYYTTAELSVWGNKIANLKVLQVNDGVSYTSVLNSSNSVLLNPIVDTTRCITDSVYTFKVFTKGLGTFILVDSSYNNNTACTPTTSTTQITICLSKLPFSWNGKSYTGAAIDTVHLTNVAGCDSAANLILNVITPANINTSYYGCNSVVFKGITYNTSTIITDTIKSNQGCDSVYNINSIIINKTILNTINFKGCNSVSYKGITYNTSAILRDTVKSTKGCDSIYNLVNILVGTPVATTKDSLNITGNNIVTYKGVNYTKSTIVQDTIKTQYGCDSVYLKVNITVTYIVSISNLGFEYNNLSYWNCYVNNTVLPSSNGVINTTASTLYAGTKYYVAGSGVKTNNIRVTSSSQRNDPYGNYPVVCPYPGAGYHSCKLGTDSVTDGVTYGRSVAQGIVYNLKIPTTIKKYKVGYYYAINLESPAGHTCDEMPFFQVEVFDSANRSLVAPCSNIATDICSASSSWNKSRVLHDVYNDGTEMDTIYYMNWTPATFIIRNMGGRTLSMRFTSAGCTLGAHFGYAYLDFDTVSNYIPDTLRYRSSDTSFSYSPPSGYKGYTIIDSATGQQLGIDTSHSVGTVTAFNMSGTNMPKPKSVMRVALIPYNGTGCIDTINYYIDTFSVTQKSDTVYLSGCNSVSYNGNVYNSSAVVYKSTSNYQGNDSPYHVVIISVNKIVPKQNKISLSSCDSVIYNSKVYYSSTALSFTTKSYQGCDSIYNIVNININNSSISGGIYHPSKGYTIPNVSALMNGSNTMNISGTGNYSFNCLTTSSNGTVRLYKNNDINKTNGVTALDIALTQSHVLGKNLFNSPYKIIAADVTGDGKVTALDIVYMKRLILGIDTTFTNSTTSQKRLWAFVDSSYKFADSTNPFPFKDSISYAGLSASKTNQTFIGCKLGDVNWDWNPAVLRPMINNVNAVELSYNPVKANNEQFIRIPVRVKNFKEMLGMQFTISFDPTVLKWQGLGDNPLGIETGTTHANEGSVSFLWVDEHNYIKTLDDGSVLMELVFKPNYQLSTINYQLILDGSVTSVVAYDKDYQLHNVVFKPSAINSLDTKDVWTVSPNPTKDGVINIQMNLKEGKRIVFRLIDNTGRILLVKQVEGVKGCNNINLKEGNIPGGTYYLQAVGVEGVKQLIIDN